MLLREGTAMGADLIARLPKPKLIVTVGTWNASIDFAAAKAHGVVVSGTPGCDPNAAPALIPIRGE
jgi:lactate dehydrogenase-like 2-hydroxyacid dehydrogenase